MKAVEKNIGVIFRDIGQMKQSMRGGHRDRSRDQVAKSIGGFFRSLQHHVRAAGAGQDYDLAVL